MWIILILPGLLALLFHLISLGGAIIIWQNAFRRSVLEGLVAVLFLPYSFIYVFTRYKGTHQKLAARLLIGGWIGFFIFTLVGWAVRT